MDNTETLTKFGTPDTGWRKTKQRKEINTKQKNKKISNTDPIWKPWVNTCALGGKQRPFIQIIQLTSIIMFLGSIYCSFIPMHQTSCWDFHYAERFVWRYQGCDQRCDFYRAEITIDISNLLRKLENWQQNDQQRSVFLVSKIFLSRKSWQEKHALENRINWGIYAPYIGAVGMLIHVNRKFTMRNWNNHCCRKVFIFAIVIVQLLAWSSWMR